MKTLFWVIVAFVIGVIYGFDGADNLWKKAFDDASSKYSTKQYRYGSKK